MEEQAKFIIVMMVIMLVTGMLHCSGVSLCDIVSIGVGAYLATYVIFALF